ncbi:NMD3-related protein [Oxyplasma meridianum]|uniref:NMD3-related protein n=1 Tax=Oxyplasma meridianum TaxID=3073602 RepID=A0AAX4NHD3_9ARCH
MLCILCGKEEVTEGRLCKNCMASTIDLSVPDFMEITQCPKCASVMIGKSWYRGDIVPRITKSIGKIIVLNNPGFRLDISWVGVDLDNANLTANLKIFNGGTLIKEENVVIKLKITKNSCPTCNRVSGSYYESILQVRTFSHEATEVIGEVEQFAVKFIESAEGSNPTSFISKVVSQREGVDIYLGKRSDALKLSKIIMDMYFSNLKVSKSLAGMKEGSEIYRYTYSIRIFNLKLGSIIESKSQKFVIIGIHPQTIYVLDPRDMKKRVLKRADVFDQDWRIVDALGNLKKFIVLSSGHGESEIMDSVTFKTHTVKLETEEKELDLIQVDNNIIVPQ